MFLWGRQSGGWKARAHEEHPRGPTRRPFATPRAAYGAQCPVVPVTVTLAPCQDTPWGSRSVDCASAEASVIDPTPPLSRRKIEIRWPAAGNVAVVGMLAAQLPPVQPWAGHARRPANGGQEVR
ncbi:hypothetical protein GCM10022402_14360 [Salinactinospora qingdaonensis]|uniref:Uncharacterized protein n=1 Tax=Salinactinospora qingdaonensis TaxID=702744 RepID=A0ABP7FD97_9ACTN